MRNRRRAFTLVELLVVIGIIAVLVAILLPSLAAARRQTLQVKCMSNLRQIGMAWRMYAEENKGAAIPNRVGGVGISIATRVPYSLYGITYGAPTEISGQATVEAAWWMNFAAKYLSKNFKGGAGDQTLQVTADQRNMVWWCPAWEGIYDVASFQAGKTDRNPQACGYAPNYMPTFTNTYPPFGTTIVPPKNDWMMIELNGNTTIATGTWWKMSKFAPSANKALLGDSYYYQLAAKSPPPVGTFPPQRASFTVGEDNGITGQTTYDWFRHGTYPKVSPGNAYYMTTGGKVSYNILYADGHVANSNDKAEAYRSIRMRYPG